MGIQKEELQVWLTEWHKGTLPFDAPLGDSYFSRVAGNNDAGEAVEKQPQLRAAFELRDKGLWDDETYQTFRRKVEEEYDITPELPPGEASPTFSPWSPTVQSRPLPPGWGLDKNGKLVCKDPKKSTMTGKVPETETVKLTSKVADPTRDNGRFLSQVAEVWYYSPTDGLLNRQVFADPVLTALRANCKVLKLELANAIKDAKARAVDPEDLETDPDVLAAKKKLSKVVTRIAKEGPVRGRKIIAKAWGRATQLRSSWEKLGVRRAEGCVFLKFRMDEFAGNRWVFIADALGKHITPQEMTYLHSQAKANLIKAKVGEVLAKTKTSHIRRMLSQNVDLNKSRLVRVDPDDFEVRLQDSRLTVETPCLEPPDKNEIAYSIRFHSGEIRIVSSKPLGHTKENGTVTLMGHRKRAYRLLLDSASGRCDAPQTVKYTVCGGEDEMPTIHVVSRDQALDWAESLDEEDEEIAKIEAECQYGEEEDNLSLRGTVIPERADEYICRKGRRLAKIDPPDARRAGPAMHNPPTRVDYVKGRHFWGNCKQTRTVSGQDYLEAQFYNM